MAFGDYAHAWLFTFLQNMSMVDLVNRHIYQNQAKLDYLIHKDIPKGFRVGVVFDD